MKEFFFASFWLKIPTGGPVKVPPVSGGAIYLFLLTIGA